jgi:hypothetical protein
MAPIKPSTLQIERREFMKHCATFEYDGILFINTTAVHIDAAFKFAVDEPDLNRALRACWIRTFFA